MIIHQPARRRYAPSRPIATVLAAELATGIVGGILVFSPLAHPHDSSTPAYEVLNVQPFSVLTSQPTDTSDVLHIEVLEADPTTWEVSYGSVSATEFVRANPKYLRLPTLRLD